MLFTNYVINEFHGDRFLYPLSLFKTEIYHLRLVYPAVKSMKHSLSIFSKCFTLKMNLDIIFSGKKINKDTISFKS